MAITVDVITKVVDSSVKSSTDNLERRFGQSGRKAGDDFAKALAAGVSKNKDVQRSFDRAADATGKLRVEQEKLNAVNAKGNATNAQKIAQAERVEKAKREEARAVSAAADAYVKYSVTAGNAIDTVNRSATGMFRILSNLSAGSRFGGIAAGLSSMSAGFTEAGAAAGVAGASMTATAAIAAGTVVIGLAAATAGAVALTNKLYDLGSEWDNVFDSVQVTTGATGDVLAQIQQSIKDVAGELPIALDSIGQIAASVGQNLKLVGDPAEDIITKLGKLNSFGVDVDIHSLGMAFRALEVDQSKYGEALEQFFGLSQRTGISIDSISSAVEANAGALKMFGFSAGEVVSIMEMFEQAGIDPDKGIGALGKAFKALTDADLEPTKENLQLVFDDINRLINSGNLPLANEELNQLFGARGGGLAWSDLIVQGQLDLNGLADAAEAPRSSIDQLADSTYDFSETWAMTWNDMKVAVEPLSTEIFKFVNESLEGITNWMKDHKSDIIGFFTFFTTQVVNLAEVIVGTIGFALFSIGKIGSLLPDWLGGKQFKAVADAGQDLMDFGTKLDGLQDKLQALGDRANSAAQLTQDFGNNLKLLPDKRTIVLEDNSAEAIAKIDQTKYKLETLPNGEVMIIPKDAESWDAYNAWVAQANGVPIEPVVKPDKEKSAQAWEDYIAYLQGTPIEVPVVPGSGPLNPGGILGPDVPGRGPRKFASSNRYEPGMVPNNRNLLDAVTTTFGVKAAADTGRKDSFGEHASGEALDIMVNPGGELGIKSMQGQMTGTQINEWLLAHAKDFGLQYTIWQGKQWNPDGTTSPNSGTGITGGHWDHVHARVRPGSAVRRFGPGGQNSSFSSSSDSAGMMNFGPDDNRYSPLPPGTPSPIPGLDEGPVGSTFGYNEYGEPGYYRPDSDSIRGAERSKKSADKAVTDAQERVGELQQEINDLKAQRTTLNAKETDTKIAKIEKQIKDQQDRIDELKDNAAEAERRLEDAKQGRFTPARESKNKTGGSSGLGGPLADDFGLSEGLPGLAKWFTTFAMNLAMAPALGQLSAIAGGTPQDTGYGLLGMFGARNIAAGNTPLGLSRGSDFNIGPAPLGGGVVGPGTGTSDQVPAMLSNGEHVLSSSDVNALGGQQGVMNFRSALHYSVGGPVDPNQPSVTSQAPSAGVGGEGFSGLGGLAMDAIMGATAPLDAVMGPGASQAAQMGIQLLNRTAGYVGQLAGIGVGGLLETFLPHGSSVADPNKSWLGRIATGFAGAKPALPNMSGDQQSMSSPAPPQTPEEAAALQQQHMGSGTPPGPGIQVGAINNYTPDNWQSFGREMQRIQLASNSASYGKR